MKAVTLSVSVVLLYLSMFVNVGRQRMRIDMLRISQGGGGSKLGGGGVIKCYVSCFCVKQNNNTETCYEHVKDVVKERLSVVKKDICSQVECEKG